MDHDNIKGFTLIESLIVIIVIAILSYAGYTLYQQLSQITINKAQKIYLANLATNMATMKAVINIYHASNTLDLASLTIENYNQAASAVGAELLNTRDINRDGAIDSIIFVFATNSYYVLLADQTPTIIAYFNPKKRTPIWRLRQQKIQHYNETPDKNY